MSKPSRRPVWNPRFQGDIEPPAAAAEVARLKKEHYASYDAEALDRRIAAFETTDLTDPRLEIVDAVERVLRSDAPPHQMLLPFSWDEIPAGTILWRAREMSEEALREGDIGVSDLWEPPQQFAGQGRMNEKGEPLLYACVEDPMGTLVEARITTVGSGFLLIAYEVQEPIIVRRIGVTNPDRELAPSHQAIEEKVSRFLAEVLSTPATEDGSQPYASTQKLLRTLYALEQGWESGWIYGSILRGQELLNIALEPAEAHAKLSIWRVLGGRVDRTTDGELGVFLAGFSDGQPQLGRRIGFFDFPHEDLPTLQAYFDLIADDG